MKLDLQEQIDALVIVMLKNHNLSLEDLKQGDIEHIINTPLQKEYFVLFGKYCYELIVEYNNEYLQLKLVPNKDYFKVHLEIEK